MTLARLALAVTLAAVTCPTLGATPDGTKQVAQDSLSSGDNKPSGTPTYLNATSIEAGTSDTKATLAFAGYLPTSWGDNYFLHYQLNGEAPLATKGSTDEVDIGTVSGLTAGSSAAAKISITRWPHAAEKPVEDLESVCETEVPQLISPRTGGMQYSWDQISSWSDAKESCSRAIFQTPTLQSMVDGLNAHLKKCDPLPPLPANPSQSEVDRAATAKQVCDTLKKGNGAHLTAAGQDASNLRHILAQVNELERAASETTWLLTAGPKVNRQKVSYFAKNDLSTLLKTNTTGYGADLGLTRVHGNLMASVGFSYEKSYKSNDTLQVCSPVSGSTSLKCPQGAIGAPTRMFSRIAFTEARYLMSPAFAVAPRLEYDFTSSKFAAKLPIYFVPSKDKALSGGIALGYVTHGGGGFGVTVFANKAFSLY
jgi:hypothetical protein